MEKDREYKHYDSSSMQVGSQKSVLITCNQIQAKLTGKLTPQVESEIRSQLSWVDKSICMANKRRRYAIDPKVHTYSIKDKTFLTGCVPRVKEILRRHGYSVTVEDKQPLVPFSDNLVIPDWLWFHQQQALLKATEHNRGMIKIPTGGGKSTVIALIALNLDKQSRILITVPTVSLLMSMSSTIERITNERVGRINKDYKDWCRITVGIVNTLCQMECKELSEINCLLIDEAHRGASQMYMTTLAKLTNCGRVYGLTATDFRSAGDDIVLEGVCGARIYNVSEEDLIEKTFITKPYSVFIKNQVPDVLYPGGREVIIKGNRIQEYDTVDGKPDPQDVYTISVVNNPHRNAMVVQVVLEYLKLSSLPVLILVKSINHGDNLKQLFLESGLDVPYVHGSSNKKNSGITRQEVLDGLNSKQLRVAIASKIFNEGEDVKVLGLVVNAAGGRDKKDCKQRIGRVVRTHPDKKLALYVDFMDYSRYYLTSASLDRMTIIQNTFGNQSVYVADTLQAAIQHIANLIKEKKQQ